jgi:hypothetical protein
LFFFLLARRNEPELSPRGCRSAGGRMGHWSRRVVMTGSLPAPGPQFVITFPLRAERGIRTASRIHDGQVRWRECALQPLRPASTWTQSSKLLPAAVGGGLTHRKNTTLRCHDEADRCPLDVTLSSRLDCSGPTSKPSSLSLTRDHSPESRRLGKLFPQPARSNNVRSECRVLSCFHHVEQFRSCCALAVPASCQQ